ncbi:MAG: AMP-binding protein [Parasphingopyxis sp.]|uniref:AMP-binding protein n=1 Tax=Parasphingopyxis sp. TaxID=1920299 RepID=UPI0032EE045F
MDEQRDIAKHDLGLNRIHSKADGERYRREEWWRDVTHLDDFLEQVERVPDKTAIVSWCKDGDTQIISYSELGAKVEAMASALLALGVARGDIVSMQLPNGWQFPVLAFAVMRVGAIPNPIPPIYRAHEVEFMLRHAGSSVFAVPEEFRGFSHLGLAKDMLDKIDGLEHIIVIGGQSDDGRIHDFDRMIDSALAPDPDELESRRPGADDPAVLLFTSGTTGTPKAAIHTHNTIWSAGRPIPDALALTDSDVAFMASTIGHLTGFYWGTVLPLSMGQKLVYQDVWDPFAMLELIESEGISWTLSATPFAMDLVEAVRRRPSSLGSFRAFVCGGATIPPKVALEVQSELGVGLISLWGCTEMGICTIHRVGAPIEILADSDGFEVDRMELRVVDEDGTPVDDQDEGRLQVRGPSIFAGYFRQPELTEELRTPDGWFDTGDLGRRSKTGGIRISGRSKDIIIRGGQNIPVVEIENELARIPAVRDVAVVAVPDARMGEKGCAVLVTDGADITLEAVREHLAESGMAKQFWPEFVHVINEMPRTPAGKIKKYALREQLAHLGARKDS